MGWTENAVIVLSMLMVCPLGAVDGLGDSAVYQVGTGVGHVMPPSDRVLDVSGLRFWRHGGWQPLPPKVALGDTVHLGVEIRNTSPAAASADLYASVDITPLGDQPRSQTLTGSGVVTVAPYASYVLQLSPQWIPGAVGDFRLDGVVLESGGLIGDLLAGVEVLNHSEACVVPMIDLP